MPYRPSTLPQRLALGLLAIAAAAAQAQNMALIRKNLAERAPQFPPPDEVTKTPIPGLYEMRVGNQIIYVDENADKLREGDLIDTSARTNLTQARVDKLNQVDFSSLQLKDAIVWKNGNGKRRIAVFADPNCGYCRQFEKTLQEVKDITVYTFVIPILGGDSPEKAKAIWCAKDNTTAWRSWMLDGKAPPRVMGACDASAIERNLALSRKVRVTGTPAIVFEDGSRTPGALPGPQLEKKLAALSGRKG
jgi:thiol:disulfide interchange protein DsbC